MECDLSYQHLVLQSIQEFENTINNNLSEFVDTINESLNQALKSILERSQLTHQLIRKDSFNLKESIKEYANRKTPKIEGLSHPASPKRNNEPATTRNPYDSNDSIPVEESYSRGKSNETIKIIDNIGNGDKEDQENVKRQKISDRIENIKSRFQIKQCSDDDLKSRFQIKQCSDDDLTSRFQIKQCSDGDFTDKLDSALKKLQKNQSKEKWQETSMANTFKANIEQNDKTVKNVEVSKPPQYLAKRNDGLIKEDKEFIKPYPVKCSRFIETKIGEINKNTLMDDNTNDLVVCKDVKSKESINRISRPVTPEELRHPIEQTSTKPNDCSIKDVLPHIRTSKGPRNRFNIFTYDRKLGVHGDTNSRPASQVPATAVSVIVPVEKPVIKSDSNDKFKTGEDSSDNGRISKPSSPEPKTKDSSVINRLTSTATIDMKDHTKVAGRDKSGPEDRFKVVKIEPIVAKEVGRWTLVDYNNRSAPVIPQQIVTNRTYFTNNFPITH